MRHSWARNTGVSQAPAPLPRAQTHCEWENGGQMDVTTERFPARTPGFLG